MKINPNFIIRDIAGELVIVPTGTAAQHFNGMITVNSVAGFMWEHMAECSGPDEMIDLVTSEFEVDQEIAKKDVTEFLTSLKKIGMIDF